jgi:hypothetical protein
MGINAVESAVTVAAVEGPNIGLQRSRCHKALSRAG